jgi:hypothetical protein
VTAIKTHDGKARMDLLPLRALAEVARAFASGLKNGRKPWNWLQGADWSLYHAAALRHLAAFQDREDSDPESGLSHLAHAIASILILLTYQLMGLGTDDRPSTEQHSGN